MKVVIIASKKQKPRLDHTVSDAVQYLYPLIIKLTWLRRERLTCHARIKKIKAGIYINKSETRTVARIKTLLDSVSIPRDLSSSNQEELKMDPLQVE